LRDTVETMALFMSAKINARGLVDPFLPAARQFLSRDELAEAERKASAPEMERIA
jgi:hypothetical protein